MSLDDYYQNAPIPKPPLREKVKARGDRYEAAVIRRVRREVVNRDGYCRVSNVNGDEFALVGWCEGVSEWAHLEEWRRFRTMGQRPEDRHTEEGTAQLCTKHHAQYDAHQWEFQMLTTRGANGPMRIVSLEQR